MSALENKGYLGSNIVFVNVSCFSSIFFACGRRGSEVNRVKSDQVKVARVKNNPVGYDGDKVGVKRPHNIMRISGKEETPYFSEL